MTLSDFYIATALSMFVSLIVEENFGLLSGGMIVPGVLALHFYSFPSAIAIVLISILTYLIVEYGLDKIMILYGKRKFAAIMLTALAFKALFDFVSPQLFFSLSAYRGIGAIIPALLANTYTKQGIKYTLPTALICAGIIFLILNILYWI